MKGVASPIDMIAGGLVGARDELDRRMHALDRRARSRAQSLSDRGRAVREQQSRRVEVVFRRALGRVGTVVINAMLDEMDVEQLTRQVVEAGDVEGIVRDSTASVSAEMVDTLRLKGALADRVVNKLVDTALLRHEVREGA